MSKEPLHLNNRRNSTWIALLVGALFVGIILFTQLAQNPSQYENQLAKIRAQKDLQFKNDPDSPIPKAVRDTFGGLAYFPIQEIYRVDATWLPNPRPDTIRLMSTKGGDSPDRLVSAGQLQFDLLNQTHSLTAFTYVDLEVDHYFVPFRDLTTGVSTYGGGRYLEVDMTAPLVMDFNRAYNPYCVYNESFVCPLPPRDNYLPLEIRAGELDFRYAH